MSGDLPPWHQRVAYDDDAPEWAQEYADIHLTSCWLDGGDRLCIYLPDDDRYLDEWIVSTFAVELNPE